MRRPAPRWRILGAAALVLLVVGGGAVATFRGLSTPENVATACVTRGTFRRAVTALGSFSAAQATPIASPADVMQPQKIAFLAEDGATVEAGDVVVVFDTSEAEIELRDGQTDRSIAENKIESSKARRDETQQRIALGIDLTDAKLGRAEELDLSDTDIFSKHDVVEAAVDRELLEDELAIGKRNRETSRRLNEAEIALGAIERSKAEIRIRQAETALRSLEVKAPHDGIFMLKSRGSRVLAVGQQVWPGQTIGEIPDLSVLEARVLVLEADAAGLAVGCRAEVSIEGKPGRTYPAVVRHVGSVGQTARESPVKYFETVLALDEMDPETMRPGQRVQARIVLEEQEDALSIPRGALFEKDGERIVFRRAAGGFEPVAVEVGRASLARVVVTSGVEEGDRVALRDPTRVLREILEARGASGLGGQENGQ